MTTHYHIVPAGNLPHHHPSNWHPGWCSLDLNNGHFLVRASAQGIWHEWYCGKAGSIFLSWNTMHFTVPPNAVTLLATFGVVSTDTLYEAMVKLAKYQKGMHPDFG